MPILSIPRCAYDEGVSKLGHASSAARTSLHLHHPAVDGHARSLVAETDFLGLFLCSRYKMVPDTIGRICWRIDCGGNVSVNLPASTQSSKHLLGTAAT